jgi:uncharacterized protein (DUF4415 family)
MPLKQRVTKKARNRRKTASGSVAGRRLRSKKGVRKGLTLIASSPELYRPIKKPVTLRLDADVIAWFKKEGRRYQTRINQALRKVMEREMKSTKR